MKQELKGEIDKLTVIARDFNIPLLVTDRASRQKISKDMDDCDRSKDQDVQYSGESHDPNFIRIVLMEV